MINRRRMMTILAGAATLPAFGFQANATSSQATDIAQWRGIALGAQAHIILDHPDAEHLIARSVDEIHRLEKIFSLYLADSQISRLNATGHLENPAFEMVELLSICSQLHARTDGAFDPTVQGLWALYAQQYSNGDAPTEQQITEALTMTGWQHLQFSPQRASFDRAGVQLTLNGIAQGYIADKVTAILRSQGVQNVMVNTGEISAMGRSDAANFWPVTLANTNGKQLELRDQSVATSAPLGTSFDAVGKTGHILDPRSGKPNGKWAQVSVISKTAAVADGLSTAFCLMDADEIAKAKGRDKVHLIRSTRS